MRIDHLETVGIEGGVFHEAQVTVFSQIFVQMQPGVLDEAPGLSYLHNLSQEKEQAPLSLMSKEPTKAWSGNDLGPQPWQLSFSGVSHSLLWYAQSWEPAKVLDSPLNNCAAKYGSTGCRHWYLVLAITPLRSGI